MSLPVDSIAEETRTAAIVARWQKFSWTVAGWLTLVAVLVTGFQLELRRRPATPENLSQAERWAVRAELQEDFAWLRAQAAEPTGRVADWLDAVELAHLQRRQFYPDLTEAMFRDWVLAPQADDPGEVGLRRALWTHFAPRVRKESELPAAAAIVARELRTRVTPASGLPSAGLNAAWVGGVASLPNWERLYVAALRACGVAARLTALGRAECWTDGQWTAAPRPLGEETHE